MQLRPAPPAPPAPGAPGPVSAGVPSTDRPDEAVLPLCADHHDRPAGRSRERGSVTAETAVLLPVLLVVLGAALGVLACVAAQLRCVDAARGAARAAARGDGEAVVRATGQRLAPPGARVVVTTGGDTVQVAVTAQVRPFGRLLGLLPPVEVSGRAVAAAEDQP